ncbi:MAG: F0F1 ATP synthase subunit A [Bacteroidota bacterium]
MYRKRSDMLDFRPGRLLRGVVAVLLLSASFVAPAQAAGEGETELDAVKHAADAIYLDFAPFGKLELPRLLLTSGPSGYGFDVFGSTKAALRSGRYHAEVEPDTGEEMVRLTAAGDLEALIEDGEHVYATVVPAAPDTRVAVDFSITKHFVFGLLAMALCLIVFLRLARQYDRGQGRTSAPKGTLQNLFEVMVLFVRDEIARPNLGDKTNKFLPYLLTAFFFILFCNIIGLVPFGAAATSNIAITGVLATFTFIITQVYASKDHWMHVFWPPGVPVLVKLILIPVEILGLFTKPIALAIRLFANMTAGYLVILSLIGLIFTFNALFGGAVGGAVSPVSVALTVFILLLKLLVAFIQAYVFTMLSALFIGMAAEEHDHHHDHGHEAHPVATAHVVEGAAAVGASGDGVPAASTASQNPEPVTAA